MPDTTPGNTTSEFTATKWTAILGAAAVVVGTLVDILTQLQPTLGGAQWFGPVLAILGFVGSVLATLGYTWSRTQVKVAAHTAAGDAAVAQSNADAAAANLGKA
ncbi:MAG TPA: hypothetical protein PK948_04990 [Gemmatimonadales bacterium]|nr:hypothetical protein [Gemmatimonadales bacterium]